MYWSWLRTRLNSDMFKKYTYDDMKGLLETWLETVQVGENNVTQKSFNQLKRILIQKQLKRKCISTSSSDVKDFRVRRFI